MRAKQLEVSTTTDGSVIIHPRGPVGIEQAVELRQVVVHAVRHIRPLRLVLDLADVSTVDPINVGTVAAACALGDDHQVIVFVDNPPCELAGRLRAAGVPAQRLRFGERN
jgi:anti-anti-sigma regulatory factor